jgi:hypothetical protein
VRLTLPNTPTERVLERVGVHNDRKSRAQAQLQGATLQSLTALGQGRVLSPTPHPLGRCPGPEEGVSTLGEPFLWSKLEEWLGSGCEQFKPGTGDLGLDGFVPAAGMGVPSRQVSHPS